MHRYVVLACLVIQGVLCNTQTFHQQPVQHDMMSRSGFGANANLGFGDSLGGSAGFQLGSSGFGGNVGVSAPSFNNNLLMTVVVGLGILSLLNIVATVVTPLLTKVVSGGDKPAASDPATARRYQQNMAVLADYVLNAIENFGAKTQEQPVEEN